MVEEEFRPIRGHLLATLPPPESSHSRHASQQLVIVFQGQGQGKEDYWSLFVSQEGQAGNVYQVKGEHSITDFAWALSHTTTWPDQNSLTMHRREHLHEIQACNQREHHCLSFNTRKSTDTRQPLCNTGESGTGLTEWRRPQRQTYESFAPIVKRGVWKSSNICYRKA